MEVFEGLIEFMLANEVIICDETMSYLYCDEIHQEGLYFCLLLV